MNKGLLIALAVVGAATAYLQTQGSDDDLVAKPGNGRGERREQRESRPHDGDAARQAGGRPQAGERAQPKSAAVAPWAADALVQGAQAWQARAREDAVQAAWSGGAASAWSAATPPPPPVLRPPTPTEVVVVAPPVPTAPRFPHPWVGRFNDGAVLSGPDTTWVVRPGDVIEGQWRVDRVDERRMSLTFLPLNLTQQVVMR
jgi:hypothetical protein